MTGKFIGRPPAQRTLPPTSAAGAVPALRRTETHRPDSYTGFRHPGRCSAVATLVRPDDGNRIREWPSSYSDAHGYQFPASVSASPNVHGPHIPVHGTMGVWSQFSHLFVQSGAVSGSGGGLGVSLRGLGRLIASPLRRTTIGPCRGRNRPCPRSRCAPPPAGCAWIRCLAEPFRVP